jgi:hypothetical protein
MVDDRQGNLLFGSWAGLFILPKRDFMTAPLVHLNESNGLMDTKISGAIVDHEYNVWIGSVGKGLAKLTRRNVVRFPLGAMDISVQQSIATADTNNHVWVICSDGLWEFFNDQAGSWRSALHHLNGRNKHKVFSLFYDAEGFLWLSYSDESLECYRIVRSQSKMSELILVRSMQIGKYFPTSVPTTFMVDRQKHIWYGEGGLLLLDPARANPLVRVFGDSSGVPTNYVRSLLQDVHGNIWCGSQQDGLAMISESEIGSGSFHRITSSHGLSDDMVRALSDDRSGRILVGTQRGGAMVIENGKIRILRFTNALPVNVVWSILEDSAGRIWLGTERGLAYMDSINATSYHRSDITTECPLSSGITRSGIFWFLCGDGLTLYDPTGDRKDTLAPPVFISQFRVNEKLYDIHGSLELSHDQNNCVVDFVGLSFKDESAIRYQYRLNGVNPDWLPPTNQNSVTYAGLGSGTYFFEVKAMNADGILSSVPASVMFTISPAVWQRWWFAGSIGFVLILLTAWLIRARVQRLLQIERMRSRIATDLHDEIGSNLGGIALMSDMVRRQVAAGGPESKQLADISLAARRMSDALRDIVWIINPMHDRMDNIILRMKDVASTLLSGIPYSLQAPEKVLTEVSNLEFRRNILLMYKEILHNIMKHAQATHVDIVIREERGVFRLSIADNGIGFDQSVRQNGNGLYNLKIRTEQIRGNLEIISSPHHGTSIVISAKIP